MQVLAEGVTCCRAVHGCSGSGRGGHLCHPFPAPHLCSHVRASAAHLHIWRGPARKCVSAGTNLRAVMCHVCKCGSWSWAVCMQCNPAVCQAIAVLKIYGHAPVDVFHSSSFLAGCRYTNLSAANYFFGCFAPAIAVMVAARLDLHVQVCGCRDATDQQSKCCYLSLAHRRATALKMNSCPLSCLDCLPGCR